MAGVGLVMVLATAASRADPGVPQRGTRRWMLDATVGPRRGDASGMNARLSVAWVPFGDLSPSRSDRTWYVSVGGMVAGGSLDARGPDPRWGTFILAPEVRTGVALGDLARLDAHVYLSGSVGWLRATPDGGARSNHVAMRLAAGLSMPGFRRATPRLAGAQFKPSEPDPVSPDASRAGADFIKLMVSVPLAIGVLIIPDTIEVTWERAAGLEFTGIAWGYSL